jgi:hypothetical protein
MNNSTMNGGIVHLFYGSVSIVGVGFSESRPITVRGAILVFVSIIYVFGHAK